MTDYIELDYKEAREALSNAIAEKGLTMDSQFVPWSQSRNKDEKYASLNWKVTIKSAAGHVIVRTDYSAGQAHCPAYKKQWTLTSGKPDLWVKSKAIGIECESGKEARRIGNTGDPFQTRHAIPGPDLTDVISSLLLDSSVLDYANFEQWASEFGYDADSRKAESIYRICLEIALAMRSALGDSTMSQWRELSNQM